MQGMIGQYQPENPVSPASWYQPGSQLNSNHQHYQPERLLTSNIPQIRDEFPVQGADWAIHLETCPFHAHKIEDDRFCWARLKNGMMCSHKAVAPDSPYDMPTCGVHRKFAKRATWCRAKQPCGLPCGRRCLFQAHGFQQCCLHLNTQGDCYFLKMPIELRLRIYGYLLPHKPVQAKPPFLNAEKAGSISTCMSILRVNRQIHEEATGLLYGSGSFTIHLSTEGITMCNSLTPQASPFPPQRHNVATEGNLALQDYQTQLMLLEQQNKRRLLMARNWQPLQPGPSQTSEVSQVETGSLMASIDGPRWDPRRLSLKNFSMIRSFIIEIDFVQPTNINGYPLPPHFMGSVQLESMLCDYCDQLHKLVGRLRLSSLNCLQVIIRFGSTQRIKEDALAAAQFLLQPLRRLRNIPHPEIKYVSIGPEHCEVFVHGMGVDGLNDYVLSWSQDLRSLDPPKASPVFDAYWQLERIVEGMKLQYKGDPRLEHLGEIIHAARIARESENVSSFRQLWGRVFNLWMDFLQRQREFESNMAVAVDGINGLLLGGEN